MKCQLCKTNEAIYSGIDAFLLNVPTETVCYDCAPMYVRSAQQIKEGV